MNYIDEYITAPFKVLYNKSHSYIKNYYNNENNDQDIEVKRYYDRIDTYSQVLSFFKSPTHIIDNIFVGNARNAASKSILKENDINMIINVTEDIPIFYPDIYTYHQIKIEDNNKDSIKNFLEESYIEIKKFQDKSDKNILIHCFMGASRSVSILIYYILKEKKTRGENIDVDEVITYIKNKRSIINPTLKLISDIKEIINLIT
jgi:predicted protein tyrosine phosphatase